MEAERVRPIRTFFLSLLLLSAVFLFLSPIPLQKRREGRKDRMILRPIDAARL